MQSVQKILSDITRDGIFISQYTKPESQPPIYRHDLINTRQEPLRPIQPAQTDETDRIIRAIAETKKINKDIEMHGYLTSDTAAYNSKLS